MATIRKTNQFEVRKSDAPERLVFGWAYVSEDAEGQLVVDSDGETISVAELEKAAYDFVTDARVSADTHDGPANGRLVESMMVTPDKLTALGLDESALPRGWWVGFRLDSEADFARVVSGEHVDFSIEGEAERAAA